MTPPLISLDAACAAGVLLLSTLTKGLRKPGVRNNPFFFLPKEQKEKQSTKAKVKRYIEGRREKREKGESRGMERKGKRDGMGKGRGEEAAEESERWHLSGSRLANHPPSPAGPIGRTLGLSPASPAAPAAQTYSITTSTSTPYMNGLDLCGREAHTNNSSGPTPVICRQGVKKM